MKRCYADSSALIKWYVREEGSDEMHRQRDKWDEWFTSRLAYAECLAAFARLRREGTISLGHARRAATDLRSDLEAMEVVDVSQVVLENAPTIVERESLRGADLVHMATALWLMSNAEVRVVFAADQKLLNIAAALGFDAIDPAHATSRTRPRNRLREP